MTKKKESLVGRFYALKDRLEVAVISLLTRERKIPVDCDSWRFDIEWTPDECLVHVLKEPLLEEVSETIAVSFGEIDKYLAEKQAKEE